MTDESEEHSKYRHEWMALLESAKILADEFRKDRELVPVALVSESTMFKENWERRDCVGWELDRTFVRERIDVSLAELHVESAADAEEYVMWLLVDGPMCRYCLWNDGDYCTHTHAKTSQITEQVLEEMARGL